MKSGAEVFLYDQLNAAFESKNRIDTVGRFSKFILGKYLRRHVFARVRTAIQKDGGRSSVILLLWGSISQVSEKNLLGRRNDGKFLYSYNSNCAPGSIRI